MGEALDKVIEMEEKHTDFKGQSASSSGSTAKTDHVTKVPPQPDPEKEKGAKIIEKKKEAGEEIPKRSLEQMMKRTDKPHNRYDKGEKPKFETRDEPEAKTTDDEKEKVIARMRTAKSNATIEQEIRDYKAMKPLTKEELKWVKVTALGLSKTGNLSDGQLARYKARFDRAKHNNQKI